MSSRRQRSILLGGRYRQVSLYLWRPSFSIAHARCELFTVELIYAVVLLFPHFSHSSSHYAPGRTSTETSSPCTRLVIVDAYIIPIGNTCKTCLFNSLFRLTTNTHQKLNITGTFLRQPIGYPRIPFTRGQQCGMVWQQKRTWDLVYIQCLIAVSGW